MKVFISQCFCYIGVFFAILVFFLLILIVKVEKVIRFFIQQITGTPEAKYKFETCDIWD